MTDTTIFLCAGVI